MAESSLPLKEVDKIEIVTVVDNYADLLLPDTEIVTRAVVFRPPLMTEPLKMASDTLLAEHGLCMLITVYWGQDRHTILFDTGYSQVAVLHNMALLKVDPSAIETIVLSHSHMDHTGGLFPILEKIGKRIPLVAHPDIFLYPRYLSLETGEKLLFPELKKEELKQKAELVESKGPVCIADEMALVTGEVERTTAFETGLPNALVERGGKTEKDITTDDQAILVNLKGKGLVVIAGCSHAGIINTIRYGQKITNVSKTYAVIGGFHLAGAFFEKIIEDTIGEMKKISPEILVPMHCTGWKAIRRFSEEFPSSFVLNSVGAKFLLT